MNSKSPVDYMLGNNHLKRFMSADPNKHTNHDVVIEPSEANHRHSDYYGYNLNESGVNQSQMKRTVGERTTDLLNNTSGINIANSNFEDT